MPRKFLTRVGQGRTVPNSPPALQSEETAKRQGARRRSSVGCNIRTELEAASERPRETTPRETLGPSFFTIHAAFFFLRASASYSYAGGKCISQSGKALPTSAGASSVTLANGVVGSRGVWIFPHTSQIPSVRVGRLLRAGGRFAALRATHSGLAWLTAVQTCISSRSKESRWTRSS